MGRKSTIYFGKKLEEHTTGLPEGQSVSGRINRTVDRYLAICQQHGVELTEVEVNFITTFIGTRQADIRQIKYLPNEIGQASSDVVDVGRLADKLGQAGFADLVAMIEKMGK